MSSSRGSLPKPVLNSPAQLEAAESLAANSVQMDNLLTKLMFPAELEKSRKVVRKDEHKSRLQNLRSELDYIQATNWQFAEAAGHVNPHQAPFQHR